MPTAIPDPQAATTYNCYATLNEWQVLGADIAVWNVRNFGGSSQSAIRSVSTARQDVPDVHQPTLQSRSYEDRIGKDRDPALCTSGPASNHSGSSRPCWSPRKRGRTKTPEKRVIMTIKHAAIAIVPCNDLDESQVFYQRLGFEATAIYPHHGYRILQDGAGASIHLTHAQPGWVIPDRNTHGIYFYAENVVALASEMGVITEFKPWGLIEFAVSDPSGTLVRVGWPADSGHA